MRVSLSHTLRTVLEYASNEAARTGYNAVRADHLMLALLRHHNNDACSALSSLGVDLDEMKSFIDAIIFRCKDIPYCEHDDISLSKQAMAVMNAATYESLKDLGKVMTAHLLLAITNLSECASSNFLYENGIDYDKLKAYMLDHGILPCSGRQETIPSVTPQIIASLGEQISRVANSGDYPN